MAEKDLDFKFDPSPIVNGFKKIADQSMKTFNGLLLKVGAVVGAFKGITGLMNNMPEVGQALGIAKDIFMKNLLWPLRQAVMPMLQKLLNWVRDNRAMFIKWGAVLRNIFMTVASAIKTVFMVGQQLVKGFLSFFNTVFGTKVKNLQEFLDLLSFKFAVALQFIQAMLKPMMDKLTPFFETVGRVIADILKFIGEIASSTIQGFFQSLGDPAKFLKDMAESFDKIVKALFTGKTSLQFWKDAFTGIGKIAGTMVRSVGILLKMISAIATGDVTKMVEAFKDIKAAGFDLFAKTEEEKKAAKEKEEARFAGIKKLFDKEDEIKKAYKDGKITLLQATELMAGILLNKDKGKGKNPAQKDAYISKDGRVTPISNDDNILVKKKMGGNPISVNFGNIVFNATGTNEGEAKRFVSTIVDQIRSTVNLELARAGRP